MSVAEAAVLIVAFAMLFFFTVVNAAIACLVVKIIKKENKAEAQPVQRHSGMTEREASAEGYPVAKSFADGDPSIY